MGQTAASVGFTVYSWLVGNWVLVVTNALMTGGRFNVAPPEADSPR